MSCLTSIKNVFAAENGLIDGQNCFYKRKCVHNYNN